LYLKLTIPVIKTDSTLNVLVVISGSAPK